MKSKTKRITAQFKYIFAHLLEHYVKDIKEQSAYFLRLSFFLNLVMIIAATFFYVLGTKISFPSFSEYGLFFKLFFIISLIIPCVTIANQKETKLLKLSSFVGQRDIVWVYLGSLAVGVVVGIVYISLAKTWERSNIYLFDLLLYWLTYWAILRLWFHYLKQKMPFLKIIQLSFIIMICLQAMLMQIEDFMFNFVFQLLRRISGEAIIFGGIKFLLMILTMTLLIPFMARIIYASGDYLQVEQGKIEG